MMGEWDNRSSIFVTGTRKASRIGYDNKGIFLAGTICILLSFQKSAR